MFATGVGLVSASVTAFAADTPDPNYKGDAALSSGSNAGNPPAPNSTATTLGESGSNADATAPSLGEENKGKSKVAPQ